MPDIFEQNFDVLVVVFDEAAAASFCRLPDLVFEIPLDLKQKRVEKRVKEKEKVR